MHGHWFYTADYGIFGHEVKVTERSPPDNLTQWIITQSKGFTKKGIEKLTRSVRTYVYLVLTSQVQARSSIVGNSAPAVGTQEALKCMFKALINEDYSIGIDIERYQGVLEHELSKVNFSVQFKLKHGKDERIQQQNFSEQHRHQNWFKQRYK